LISRFLGPRGTVRIVERGSPRRKEADGFYLLELDQPVNGYRRAGFWGGELEPVGLVVDATSLWRE